MHLIGMDDMSLAGGDFRQRGVFRDLVIEEDNAIKCIDPIWWYALKTYKGKHVPIPEVTSFNARNLDIPRWEEPLRLRRGLVFADAIGESNPIPNRTTKAQYLMESNNGLILGALYKCWPSEQGDMYSMAVITRPPHDRFSKYHEKSFPLFLPPDSDFLKLWLSKDIEHHDAISAVLDAPKLYTDLNVTRVKSYKSGVPMSASEILTEDG
jgi:putative SOS response-associated peptidase YedK